MTSPAAKLAFLRYRIRSGVVLAAVLVLVVMILVVQFARFGMATGLADARLLGAVVELQSVVAQFQRNGGGDGSGIAADPASVCSAQTRLNPSALRAASAPWQKRACRLAAHSR